jgi:hypothetical protein
VKSNTVGYEFSQVMIMGMIHILEGTTCVLAQESSQYRQMRPDPGEIVGEIHANRAIDRKSRFRPKF